jgi:hypothetical protein
MNKPYPRPADVPPPLPELIQSLKEAEKLETARKRNELLGLPLRIRDSAALLLLTIIADICMYKAAGGAGGAVLLVSAFAILLALKDSRTLSRLTNTGLAVLALAIVMLWHAWWLVAYLAVISIVIAAIRMWRPEWKLLESLWAALSSVFSAPPRLYGHIVACRGLSQTAGQIRIPGKVIIVPLAISVLFLIIFAAANPVVSGEFSKLCSRISDFLSKIYDYLNVGRIFFWCGWFLVFAALIRPVVQSSFIDHLMKLDLRLMPADGDEKNDVNFMTACSTLICVNVIFLGYNCIDAVYLYFKATLPAGITWTAYTHAGCGWLTFGLFLSTVVLGVIFRKGLNFHPRSNLLKMLAYIWIAQNAVLALGALRRIYMYIDFSGLTHLLITGVYGSLLVMAGLGIMAVKIRGNRNALWLLRQYTAAFAAGLMLLALTPHGFVCASYNVPRVQALTPHAMWPIILKNLPADALPPLIPLLDYRRTDGDAAREKLVREQE